jgi:hypothetical protein
MGWPAVSLREFASFMPFHPKKTACAEPRAVHL